MKSEAGCPFDYLSAIRASFFEASKIIILGKIISCPSYPNIFSPVEFAGAMTHKALRAA